MAHSRLLQGPAMHLPATPSRLARCRAFVLECDSIVHRPYSTQRDARSGAGSFRGQLSLSMQQRMDAEKQATARDAGR